VLPTAGASEAFALIATMRPWRHPAVVHPQFTEPHALLVDAGHDVTTVLCQPEDGFALHPEWVPDDCDLVVVGNPTNPTGAVHPAETIRCLLKPGRVVVVDEAFIDAIPGEPDSLAGERDRGLLVIRSLTKQWSIPGIRAGYLLGDADLIDEAKRRQVPWSVSSPAIAAMIACSDELAITESVRRANELQQWRQVLGDGLTMRGMPFVCGKAPYLLARAGHGIHAALRSRGIAVRRADTFPGLDANWIRIAVRDPAATARLLAALDGILGLVLDPSRSFDAPSFPPPLNPLGSSQ
jgi:cobyrinic acid a,c-diamide synthase